MEDGAQIFPPGRDGVAACKVCTDSHQRVVHAMSCCCMVGSKQCLLHVMLARSAHHQR
jgi:hypothetical protein